MLPEEINDLRQLVESRSVELDELRRDRVALKMETDALKVKLKDLRHEDVADSEPFKLLQSHVQHLLFEGETQKVELERVTKEADTFREAGETFREAATVSASLDWTLFSAHPVTHAYILIASARGR